MQQTYQFSQELHFLFEDFLIDHSPRAFSIFLRNMLLEHLQDVGSHSSIETYISPIGALSRLFDLLDEAEEEACSRQSMVDSQQPNHL